MLKEAHFGFLFRPSDKVKSEFPQFPVVTDYLELKSLISDILKSK